MLFLVGFAQRFGTFVGTDQGHPERVEVTFFRPAQIAPVESRRADQQGGLVISGDFADFPVFERIGIGEDSGPVINGDPEIHRQPKDMKVGKGGEKHII